MALLTVTEFKNRFETDLPTATLQAILDDAEQEIIRHVGLDTDQVDEFVFVEEAPTHVYLTRKADSISEVKETVGDETKTLAANDFEKNHQGLSLRRLQTGTNGRQRWGWRVTVKYNPVDDTVRKKQVQADLAKLAIQYEALSSSGSGNFSSSIPEYQIERQRILSRLMGVIFV